MNKPQKVFNERKRNGLYFIIAGILIFIIGVIIQLTLKDLPFRPQLIGGLGIFLAGWGIAQWVQSAAYLKDQTAGQRALNEWQDERSNMLRAKAGERSYWIMSILAVMLLFWQSFAGSEILPRLSEDSLWNALAAVVILPFVIYIITYLTAEKNN